MAGYYRRSDFHKEIAKKIEAANMGADKSAKEISRGKIQSSTWRQVDENFKRSFLNTIRNPGYTKSRIGQVIVS